MNQNIILQTDAYNLSHFFLKENVDWEISLLFNRNKPMILNGFNKIVVGLLNTKIEEPMVIEAEEYAHQMNMPFPSDMWWKIVNEFKGRIPLRVEALPDGTWCPKGTPFAKIKNTEKGYGELVSWWEGVFMHGYFPSGCATEAFHMKNYLEANRLPLNRFHSFGFRGHRSMDDAEMAGSGWNLFLPGTDDFHTKAFTTSDISSIPATAHKTIQQFDRERDAYFYSINEAHKKGFKILSIVIDTYDPHRFIDKYSVELAKYAGTIGMHLVFRPDSGNVIEQAIKLYTKLTSNLCVDNTSCIIGEGMSFNKAKEYDELLKFLGFSLNWMNYGIGSGFYNHIDRDWLGWAMKTSFSNGKSRMKFSADMVKVSIPGDVNLIINDNHQMEINFTRDRGLYQDIYNYDERSSRPKYTEQSWTDIREISNKQAGTQQDIVVGLEVQTLINELRKQYL